MLNKVRAESQIFHLRKLEVVSVEENEQFRNRVNSILHKAQIYYYRFTFKQHDGSSRETWQIVRDLTSSKNAGNEITSIMNNNSVVTDEQELCEWFNNYFRTISSVVHRNPAIAGNSLRLITRNPSSMYLTRVSTSEVSNVIGKTESYRTATCLSTI